MGKRKETYKETYTKGHKISTKEIIDTISEHQDKTITELINKGTLDDGSEFITLKFITSQ